MVARVTPSSEACKNCPFTQSRSPGSSLISAETRLIATSGNTAKSGVNRTGLPPAINGATPKYSSNLPAVGPKKYSTSAPIIHGFDRNQASSINCCTLDLFFCASRSSASFFPSASSNPSRSHPERISTSCKPAALPLASALTASIRRRCSALARCCSGSPTSRSHRLSNALSCATTLSACSALACSRAISAAVRFIRCCTSPSAACTFARSPLNVATTSRRQSSKFTLSFK